jgi:hypothetical protein
LILLLETTKEYHPNREFIKERPTTTRGSRN